MKTKKKYLKARHTVCIAGMHYTKGKLYEIVTENEFDYFIRCDEGVKEPINKINGDFSSFELIEQ